VCSKEKEKRVGVGNQKTTLHPPNENPPKKPLVLGF
jgi:hypothetical protein